MPDDAAVWESEGIPYIEWIEKVMREFVEQRDVHGMSERAIAEAFSERYPRSSGYFGEMAYWFVHRTLARWHYNLKQHGANVRGRKHSMSVRDVIVILDVLGSRPSQVGYRDIKWTIERLRDVLRRSDGCVVSAKTLRRFLERNGYCFDSKHGWRMAQSYEETHKETPPAFVTDIISIAQAASMAIVEHINKTPPNPKLVPYVFTR